MESLLTTISGQYKHVFFVNHDSFESFETANGIKHGYYTKMYKNKKIWVSAIYANGLLEGLYRIWNKDGTLSAVYRYKNGKKNGLQKEWALKGYGQIYLKKEYSCIDNVYNGLYRRWHPNGDLHLECVYFDGKVVGEFKEYL